MDWHILIVEDDFHSREVVRTLLDFYDIEVDVAENATQALDLLHDHPYTAVVIDLSLPDMSGWDLLKEIRQQEQDLPCIAITAYHSPNVALEAISYGFTAYFSKPIDVTSFVSDLAVFLK